MSFSDFVNMGHDPRPPGAPRRVWRDWALLAIATPLAVGEAIFRPDVVWRPFSLVVALAMLPLLLYRRSHPLAAVAIAFGSISVLNLVAIFVGQGQIGLMVLVFLMILPYSLFRWGSGREAVIGLGFLVAAWATSLAAEYTGLGDAIGGFIVLLFPVELGAMIRFQAKSRAQDIEQAKSMTREQLARELHDSVAHHVSAIAIQAQGGRAVASTDPDRAADVLGVIEEEASRALDEMRTMVGALRDGAEAELTPQPGVADIARLADISRFADSGQGADGATIGDGPRIDVELSGDLDGLRPAVDTALYRLAQESITNAVRHARNASQVLVKVAGNDRSVELTVVDDGIHNPPPSSSLGFGLVGMNERAKLLGGTLYAGPNGGRGWTVNAVLPRDGSLA
jgi:signal transduction histidine kinase